MRLLFAAAFLLAACSSQSTLETRPVTDNAAADGRRRAEVHTALAGEYYSRGNFAVALQEARLAINDDPAYVPAYNVQALVFMELREDGPARAAFAQALRLQPNNSEVLNNYGWFLCLRNEGKRGLEYIQRASADNYYPTPEKAFLSMGLCLRRLGRNAEAEEALRRSVLIRPDLIGALYNLAVITFERGAMLDAEIYLLRYMRLTSQPTLDALVMGVRIARAKNDSSAEQSFLQQLRRRFPEAPEAIELLEKRP
ncbi:MAG: type IV pilus biogenesis/stability protein PilW [Burkholderiales bacterium]|nr:type IV pilus biogenesis/stability protein PilW [Burkholderiales bacterium]